MWYFVTFLIVFFILYVLFIVLAWKSAGRSAERNRILMIRLNRGHQIWCTAGVEDGKHCSCKVVPYYFDLQDIKKREEIISQLAAARGGD
ncbi:hypothetical protein A3J56_01290 [Candidatus Giovannonibacteria bacterium RIFCSPHIGHO2_02_FULL_46_20]|uniref:Uncharacterized protein n=1 Tax=Candidatus Giovannonibacteria bacterium RIFCSPHIGHO2_02_FULL_46_20 TaxID=1798338 RepID=A0A1F5WG41_9BACT|nr:MAG: hypothetical protein A3J56_01290 [Candidatus Giovannonibacteria bacterium RIFCSPHIGHO2_02_FULL_46_20]